MTDEHFRHENPGTAERTWLSHPGWRRARSFSPPTSSYVVVAAHPDDETLAVGALVAELAATDHHVDALVITDGEASHPDSPTTPRDRLAELRRAESARAVAHLSPDVTVTHLGLPDGGVADHLDEVGDRLLRLTGPDTTLISPWTRDGHPDHDAAGRAAEAVALAAGLPHLMYPVWWWHRALPDDHPWDTTLVSSPGPVHLRRKASAVGAYVTQTAPLSQQAGDETLLADHVLTRFRRPFETLIIGHDGGRAAATPPSPSSVPFDAMFDAGPDPWGFSTSWYEHRKRSLLMASLPAERYAHAMELGCSTGQLTQALAARSGRVTAIDASRCALEIAAERLPKHVELVHGTAPDGLPVVRADLVVLSEVGYYLTGIQLLRTLQWAERSADPNGTVVLCHWQHPTDDLPLDGRLVHQLARQVWGPPSATYTDTDVELLLFT